MVEIKRRTPSVGETAPSFSLKNSDLKELSLGEFQGKTAVLLFFPAAFSGTCTMELCTFREHIADMVEVNAQVVGISVDLPYTLREFRRTSQLSFQLLSDFDRTTINQYGVVDEDFHGYHAGVAMRSVFVVDAGGTIAWTWVAERQSDTPEFGDVYEAVERLAQ